MQKFSLILVLWSVLKSCLANTNLQVPDDFEITQHWFSFTTSFDIEYNHKKIASLYRRALTPILTYDFYDEYDQYLAKAKARVFSYNVKFDVYDPQHQRIGIIKEDLFRFFPTFRLYNNHGRELAQACLNLWGTTFTIYDAYTHEEIAYMTRGLLRLKNDWEVHIINRPLYEARRINPYLFLTALAFQGDRETWEHQAEQKFQANLGNQPINKSNAIATAQPDLIDAWAKRWDQRFKTTYPDYYQQDLKTNLEHMLKIGHELRQSPNLNQEDSQALATLFKLIQQTEEN